MLSISFFPVILTTGFTLLSKLVVYVMSISGNLNPVNSTGWFSGDTIFTDNCGNEKGLTAVKSHSLARLAPSDCSPTVEDQ